jgi:hypothetical protein
MKPNSWQSRLLFAVALWLANVIHRDLVADVSNTPVGMLAYHGLAALFDMLLLICAPLMLSGRLCDDLQALCLASMVINFLGWIAYLAYAPPSLYNWMIWSCGYVQWARLLYVDRHDADRLGFDLVPGADRWRRQFHIREANK